MKKEKKAWVKLTNGFVKNLTSKSERYFEHDFDCPGLSLKIEPYYKTFDGLEKQGIKTWIWRYRPPGKKVQTITIGRLEYLSPDKARKRVKDLQNKHLSGKAPIAEKNKW